MQKDYFSSQADAYRSFRPGYPDELFRALCRDLPADALAWDCATGNGQAASKLARHAARVVASDQSAAQLGNAVLRANVYYVRARAEQMPLADHCVDLVTVAQALHWFDFDRFYTEVRRILRPGGMIAAWTYSFLTVTPQLGTAIDEALRWFYADVVGPYWPPERRWVDEQYRSIPFPFTPVNPGEFAIELAWDLRAVLGYVASWSATARYRTATGSDPVPELERRLRSVWSDADAARPLRWPLGIRCGRV